MFSVPEGDWSGAIMHDAITHQIQATVNFTAHYPCQYTVDSNTTASDSAYSFKLLIAKQSASFLHIYWNLLEAWRPDIDIDTFE